MMKAEVSQSMLKHSSQEEVSIFVARVINYINPKFQDETEMKLAEADLIGFAKTCELTCEEFLLALRLAAEKKLVSAPDENGNSEVIKLFREIDSIKFGEIKSAYLYRKTIDTKYESDKVKIKAFLNPPKEVSPEERRATIIKMLTQDHERLMRNERVIATTKYYDWIVKVAGVTSVRVPWLVEILESFEAESSDMKLEQGRGGLLTKAKVTKNDPVLFFKEHFVNAYNKIHKLHRSTLEEWKAHWLRLYDEGIKNESKN